MSFCADCKFCVLNQIHRNIFDIGTIESFKLENILNLIKGEGIGKVIAIEPSSAYEESKVSFARDKEVRRIGKGISSQKAYGTSIDVYLFPEELRKVILDRARDIIVNLVRRNEWTEVVIDEVIKGFPVYPFYIKKVNVLRLVLRRLGNSQKLYAR